VQHGTAAQVAARETSMLTDGVTAPAPFGIGLEERGEFDGPVYPAEHRLSVNVGSGTATMGV
jgi:hypothetical protein